MANWTLCSPAPGAAAAPLEPLRRASVIRSSNQDISRRSHSRSASTAPSIRRRRSCVRRAVARRGTHARSVHVADGHHGVAMHHALVKAMPVRTTPDHTEHKGHHYERSANHLRPEQARPELQPALREDQHPGEFQPRLVDAHADSRSPTDKSPNSASARPRHRNSRQGRAAASALAFASASATSDASTSAVGSKPHCRRHGGPCLPPNPQSARTGCSDLHSPACPKHGIRQLGGSAARSACLTTASNLKSV